MDVPTAVLGVGIFIISGAVLLLISMFGIKEKSYEEAIAEQKQQNNTLFGNNNRFKSKDKKQKKIGKKVKEKQQNVDSEINEESENTDIHVNDAVTTTNHAPHIKLHVEFKEPTVFDAEKENMPTQLKTHLQKRTKKDKVRPILVNKEITSENVIDNVVEVPPANHFEKLHPKDEFELMHTKEEVVTKQDLPKEKSKKQHLDNEIPKNNKKSSKHQISQTVETSANVVSVEEKKVDPISEPVTVPANVNGISANPGKEKKKRKAEFNTLQQLTGDKQGINVSAIMKLVRTAEMSRSEVQTLIDLLLNKQHEAPAVLDEWSEGKADPVQKLKRQLAEKEKALLEEQEALMSAQAKLREIRAEQNAERSALQQRIRQLDEILQVTNTKMHAQNQQMQVQLNEEKMKLRKICDEHAAMQMQRQQLELRIAQTQEAEATILQLRNEIQELQQRSNVEIHNLKDQQLATNAQLQHQLSLFTNDISQKDEIIRNFKEREENYAIALRQEAELKAAFQQRVEEIRRLELKNAQLSDESVKQKDESDRLISQLRTDLQKNLDEKIQLQEANVNGSRERNKAHQIELLNLRNELASVKSQLIQTQEKLSSEFNDTVNQLKDQLEEQKTKNNELREKNWKVMEALNATETRLKASQNKENNINLEEKIRNVKIQEQQELKKFIQRLFPDIDVSIDELEDIEKTVETHINALQESKSTDVSKLQAELKYYKTIIDDTEGMLNKLQAHVEKEEINWRNQLKLKENEIEALKEKQINQLQETLLETQKKLLVEQEARQLLMTEIETLRKHKSQTEDMGVVEKLSDEVNRLREQLLHEQKKNEELVKSPVVYNTNVHNTTNGTTIVSEQMLSSTSSAASSLAEVTLKPKSKKKKKKNNQ